VPFRDGVKADNVTDRVEIITRLSNLMNCALHETAPKVPAKRAEDGEHRERDNCTYYYYSPLYGSSGRGEQPALIPDAEGMQ